MKSPLLLFVTLLASPLGAEEHPLASSDPAVGRQAIQTYVSKGTNALPELRKLAKSPDHWKQELFELILKQPPKGG